MTNSLSWAERQPVLFAAAATVVFMVLLLAAAPLGNLLQGAALEWAASAVRGIVAIVAWAWARRLRWVGSSPFARPRLAGSWRLVLPCLVYLLLVYPYLFTGSWALRVDDRWLAVAVAVNGAAAGLAEELFFRGLVLRALAGPTLGRRRLRAVIVSSLLFSAPHALNLVVGHQPLRVGAQLLWAFELAIVFACLVIVTGSVWTTVALHGVANAYMHVNRIGVPIDPSPGRALLMALAPIPLVAAASWYVSRRIRGQAGRLPAVPAIR